MTIDRRRASAAMLGAFALPVLSAAPPAVRGGNILRVPLEAAETGSTRRR